MWKFMAVRKKGKRKLRSDERERVQDAMQLIESARETLSEVDDNVMPERAELEECFDMADRSLKEALRS
jgi:hypothetical protein